MIRQWTWGVTPCDTQVGLANDPQLVVIEVNSQLALPVLLFCLPFFCG